MVKKKTGFNKLIKIKKKICEYRSKEIKTKLFNFYTKVSEDMGLSRFSIYRLLTLWWKLRFQEGEEKLPRRTDL